MKKITVIFSLLAMFVLAGCNTRIPPGYVGMKMELGGSSGKVLPQGLHGCYGRERMVAIELAEQMKTEELSILCKDDLNFAFDLKLRSKLRESNPEAISRLLNVQGKNIDWNAAGDFGKGCPTGILTWEFLYVTYVQASAKSIARDVVSKYQTTDIRENRESIQAEIQKRLAEALKQTPMEVTMVAASNFDYPDVITKAVEKRRAREIAIKEEEAKQKMKMLEAENRQKIAEKMKTVRVAEAEAEAAYNKITGQSLTPEYLRMREIEAQQIFFQSISDKDKVIFFPSESVTPMMPISQ